jgi:hypothetical protein
MFYAESMTLSSRNRIFKAGIFVSLVILTLVLLAALKVLPGYPDLVARAARRAAGPPGLWSIEALAGRFWAPVPYAPFVTMAAAIAYAFVTMIFIFYYFEKTPAPEILFIAFFVLSFVFEAARIAVPLMPVLELPSVFLIMVYRAMLFGRYFGIFSLFVASACAAGLELQRQGGILVILTLSSLVIALGMPIGSLAWDTSLCVLGGYSSMSTWVEIGMMFITMVSFFVSARSRGAKEYLFIGLGSFLVFIGRNMLFRADTWITPLPGLILLITGTWFICGRLHRVYLWL